MNNDEFKLYDGDVHIWIEQEAIHMVAIDRTDPVELTGADARKIAAKLIEMADFLDE
jgi:hypothetical protein